MPTCRHARAGAHVTMLLAQLLGVWARGSTWWARSRDFPCMSTHNRPVQLHIFTQQLQAHPSNMPLCTPTFASSTHGCLYGLHTSCMIMYCRPSTCVTPSAAAIMKTLGSWTRGECNPHQQGSTCKQSVCARGSCQSIDKTIPTNLYHALSWPTNSR